MQIIRAGVHFLLLTAGLFCALDVRAGDASDMIVHEWGTFTSLQDENGEAIGGINTDDEPVPDFVHRLAKFLMLKPTQVPPIFFQGAPRCHPDVTLRLETPVVYFHPPEGQRKIPPIDVKVAFRGGWLTEFYPNARSEAPGVSANGFNFGPLTSQTIGTLEWSELKVGGSWNGPETKEHVWLAPRNVKAASIQTPAGESEKYLFYRGVGHIDAPLRVSHEKDQLVLRSQLPDVLGKQAPFKVPYLCLVDIKTNGTSAFRVLPSVDLLKDSNKVLATTSATFGQKDYNAGNLGKMKTSLRTALIADGLFADEADALLNTWELSYFKSAGLRVFFIVPLAWTDHVLPMQVSARAKIDRVMVGRIELITSDQRQLLKQLAQQTPEKIRDDAKELSTGFYGRAVRTSGNVGGSAGAVNMSQVMSGQKSFAEYGVTVPSSYRLYLDLGRFRNALLLDAERTTTGEGLKAFIKQYGLHHYRSGPS